MLIVASKHDNGGPVRASHGLLSATASSNPKTPP
jgi:hypothetical protein